MLLLFTHESYHFYRFVLMMKPTVEAQLELQVLTQNAFNSIMLDELDVGQSDIVSCGLNKRVTFVFLLYHHFIRKTKAWNKKISL